MKGIRNQLIDREIYGTADLIARRFVSVKLSVLVANYVEIGGFRFARCFCQVFYYNVAQTSPSIDTQILDKVRKDL